MTAAGLSLLAVSEAQVARLLAGAAQVLGVLKTAEESLDVSRTIELDAALATVGIILVRVVLVLDN
jgi:hypothetical protein